MKEMEENTASTADELNEQDRKNNVCAMQRLLLDEEACLAPAPELGIVSARMLYASCYTDGKGSDIRAFGCCDGHVTAVMRRELNPAEMTLDRLTITKASFWVDYQLSGMKEPSWCWVELVEGVLSCSPAELLGTVQRFLRVRGVIVK